MKKDQGSFGNLNRKNFKADCIYYNFADNKEKRKKLIKEEDMTDIILTNPGLLAEFEPSEKYFKDIKLKD